MPRDEKPLQAREDEAERDDVDAPRVDEIDPDDRARVRFEDEHETIFDEDEDVEDIDLEDLSAMEGPDA